MALSMGTATVQPKLIHVGPGFLWINLYPRPADGETLLVSGSASGAQDQRVYGPRPMIESGSMVGSTVGNAGLAYRPAFVDIRIESATATVEKVLESESCMARFNLAELTAENVRAALPGMVGQNPVATLKSIDQDPLMAGQYRHTITIGGLRLVHPQTIAFIAPNRRIALSSGPFSTVLCAYQAVSTEGFDMPFSRGQITAWSAAFEVLADTTRSIGDQLFQLTVRESA